MKIKITKKEMIEALGKVSSAIQTKNTIDSISKLKIDVADGILRLIGYDLEIAISCSTEVVADENFSVLVDYNQFFEMIKAMPGTDIMIGFGNGKFVIKNGNVKLSGKYTSAENYPELPLEKTTLLAEIPQLNFAKAVKGTSFAASTNDVKPIMKGCMLSFKKQEGLSITAIDGYRFALRRNVGTCLDDSEVVINARHLNAVSKIVEGGGNFKIEEAKNFLIFTAENVTVLCRKLTGEFFKIDDILKKFAAGNKVVIDKEELLGAVERASLVTSDKAPSPVILYISDDKIEIDCKSANGSTHEEIVISGNNSEIKMGFKNRFLYDALKATENDEKISFIYTKALEPSCIVKENDDPLTGEYVYVILPVRIK